MEEKKRAFVERLGDFYVQNVDSESGLINLSYQREGGNEWVYVEFRSGCRKRFNVNADNNKGIFKDFVRFLNNFDEYAWIQ